jgi:S1-C subfamily serine protease
VPAGAQDTEKAFEIERRMVEIVEKISPAYVRIGGGSGVVISPDGWMLTNNHVVAQHRKRKVWQVFMPVSEVFTADLHGLDTTGDIALLKIRGATNLPHVPLGDSDRLRPGQYVVALGNPFSFAYRTAEPTVTLGIVSAIHRNQGTYSDAIQTDAPLNPGNSGGPLIDLYGKLVGINGRVMVRFGGKNNTGAGLAIPTNQIRRFLPELKEGKGGKVIYHGELNGLRVEPSEKDDGPPRVVSVSQGSNSDKAGLRPGDIIRGVGDLPVWNPTRFWGLVHSYPSRAEVALRVLREGREISLRARLQRWFPRGGSILGGQRPPDRRTRGPGTLKVTFTETDPVIGGAEIEKVTPGSGAAKAGLRPGDIIVAIDGKSVPGKARVSLLLREKTTEDKVKLRIMRGLEEIEVEVELDLKAGGR